MIKQLAGKKEKMEKVNYGLKWRKGSWFYLEKDNSMGKVRCTTCILMLLLVLK